MDLEFGPAFLGDTEEISPRALCCRACGRILYSRKQPSCGYCGTELPRGVRFNEEQIEAIDAEISAIERQRQLRKEEDERRKREGTTGAV